jgi:hypothetical protein
LAKKTAMKAALVLEAKDSSDAFSKSYHVGYLLDYAYEMEYVQKRSPLELRQAVDVVCDQVDVSPMNHLVSRILKESASLLGAIKTFLLKIVTIGSLGKPEVSSDAISEEVPSEAMDLVEMIRTQLDLMPPKYYIDLRRSFARRLGINLEALEPGDEQV